MANGTPRGGQAILTPNAAVSSAIGTDRIRRVSRPVIREILT